ncbi:MAG TPA: LysR family transcriptional regulator [Marinobacterium sp.]|nr:LysR family transcriptional regulator [Marinobacterium sp.]
MNPGALKQLAIVVKQGSISRAADQLYITQPTLTRSIQQLEAKVGAPLLKRTRYGVQPTEIGARLAEVGDRIMREAAQADEVIRQFHAGVQSEFAVGIDPLWEFATVRQMTDALLRENRFVFHLRTGSAAAQIRLLHEGELDFLLAPAHLSVAQKNLERELLFRDRNGVFAGKNSKLLGWCEPISLAELEKHEWIVAGARAGFLDGQGELAGPAAARMVFTGSLKSVFHLLQSSDMLVRMPARLTLMTDEISDTQLLRVEGVTGPRRDIALWYRSKDMERPDFVRVREVLRKLCDAIDKSADEYGLEL